MPAHMPTTPQAPIKKRKLALVFISLIGCCLFLLFLSLGIWQVERLSWKNDLIARVDARISAEAVPVPAPQEWPIITAEKDEYRHVSVEGSFLQGKEIAVKALTVLGSGYWQMVPLNTKDGEVIYINRGFVSDEDYKAGMLNKNIPAGDITVSGLLRMSEPNGFFLRPNEPEKNLWNSRDVEAFARKQSLNQVAPYFIDADKSDNSAALSSKQPIGGLTVVNFPNNHLSYAVTWFALALMVLGGTLFTWLYKDKPKT
ncbi:SURF1 family protein [Paenochrobactrum pullorum]|uniref:SURF1 family protein n=1 Tax=Paenochrobactrum pullorum TaxID=1324351 RepID=UPI0035BBD892